MITKHAGWPTCAYLCPCCWTCAYLCPYWILLLLLQNRERGEGEPQLNTFTGLCLSRTSKKPEGGVGQPRIWLEDWCILCEVLGAEWDRFWSGLTGHLRYGLNLTFTRAQVVSTLTGSTIDNLGSAVAVVRGETSTVPRSSAPSSSIVV